MLVDGCFTTTVIVVDTAHWPDVGVKVYVVVVWLFTAGNHEPETELVDVPGNVILPSLQTAATCVKEGVAG